jgi:predicted house-cleaning noncanonical NTP pyrophosphatase (MazG superfamily)
MPASKYNKLVRDKIPQIIKQDKRFPVISRLASKKFVLELKRKLLEEVDELLQAKNKQDQIDELADILEVIQSLAKAEKIDWRLVEHRKKIKKQERGGFSERIFLKSVRQKIK